MSAISKLIKYLSILFVITATGCANAPPEQDLIAFEKFGSGPEKVLVLHDWLGDRSNYDPIRPYLDIDQFTYVFADLRGYGGSKDLVGVFTLDEAAKDALAVADNLGWQTFHIIGHSMTGMVVQRIAAYAPARIKSVVATTPVSAAGMQVDEKTFRFFKAVVTERKAASQAIGLLTGNRLSPSWTAFKVDRAMSTSTAEARLAYLEMFDKEDFSSDVQDLAVPILALLGENDLPPFQRDAITASFGAWYPNLSIVVAPNAGHYPMQETPAFYATTIEAHMKQIGG